MAPGLSSIDQCYPGQPDFSAILRRVHGLTDYFHNGEQKCYITNSFSTSSNKPMAWQGPSLSWFERPELVVVVELPAERHFKKLRFGTRRGRRETVERWLTLPFDSNGTDGYAHINFLSFFFSSFSNFYTLVFITYGTFFCQRFTVPAANIQKKSFFCSTSLLFYRSWQLSKTTQGKHN